MEWVSVKNRMPEESGTCVCWIHNEPVILYYDEEDNVWNSEDNSYREEVTHFIPLPEPPKK